ncbi:hypothetical protein G4L39_09495 [Limisphaera ngatamarikiensis]|uniref:Cellulose-binding protein n=1 Tax=Limisphaera ngatamarikiensis TaxID=1324935 RepID=A0A6M1RIT9_9BACT|nr:hypothetical protein [Limisphaera ngatamarikiensis]NGO39626.1 hypothetical protein [Limisphaera ngatamarikiensis]
MKRSHEPQPRPVNQHLASLSTTMRPLQAAALALLLAVPSRAPAETPPEPPPDPRLSRLGINLSGIADWGTEHPFSDAFKTARPWISQRAGAPWGQGPKLDLDASGWVRRLEPEAWAETLLFTAGHAPAGTYLCLYEGEGELEIRGSGRVISSAPGRIEFQLDPDRGPLFLQIRKTHVDRPIRNIRVFMPGTGPDAPTAPFHPRFLQRWRGFNTIRFMDWMETNNSRQRSWADRPTLSHATWSERGVPVEVMVDLCNRLGANPWFCMPHQADDEYVRQFARLVRDRLRSDLVVYVEYSNEVWNSIFAQHRYAAAEGRRLGFSDKDWEAAWRFTAWRSRQIHQIWEEVFGKRSRIVRVIASQAANPHVTEQILTFRDSARHFDALAIAPYFSLNVAPQRSGSTPPADEVAQWSLDQLFDHLRRHSIPEAVQHMRAQRDLAQRHGLRLIAYEAGQHLVGVQGAENHDTLTQLLTAANRHPAMGRLYETYLDAWLEVAGGDLCCLFASCGAYSKWGSWGLLEGASQDHSPKFDAVVNWNQTHLRPAPAAPNPAP